MCNVISCINQKVKILILKKGKHGMLFSSITSTSIVASCIVSCV